MCALLSCELHPHILLRYVELETSTILLGDEEVEAVKACGQRGHFPPHTMLAEPVSLLGGHESWHPRPKCKSHP